MAVPASSAPASRWQFSLRGLLVLTTAAGVSLLIATRVGVVEAALVSLGVVFFYFAGGFEWGFWPKCSYKVWLPCTVLSALCFAFGMYDINWYATHCPRCGLVWEEHEHRLFHMPVYTEREAEESERLTSRIAADIGCPCKHGSKRKHLQRWWFGMIFQPFDWTPVFFLRDDDWYGPEQSAAMQKIGREHPEVAREFHARVLEQRDLKFQRDFLEDFRQSHDPTYDAP